MGERGYVFEKWGHPGGEVENVKQRIAEELFKLLD